MPCVTALPANEKHAARVREAVESTLGALTKVVQRAVSLSSRHSAAASGRSRISRRWPVWPAGEPGTHRAASQVRHRQG